MAPALGFGEVYRGDADGEGADVHFGGLVVDRRNAAFFACEQAALHAHLVALFDEVIGSDNLHLDATGLPVRDKDTDKGIKTGSLWGLHRAVSFLLCTAGRVSAAPQRKLAIAPDPGAFAAIDAQSTRSGRGLSTSFRVARARRDCWPACPDGDPCRCGPIEPPTSEMTRSDALRSFRQALLAGIGSGKAFGFGLLSVAPAD